ncbi:MAG: hypothetical protein AAGG45_11100 [Pseudomonadota bacterium]
MSASEILIAILKDTREWASDSSNINLGRTYSEWSSQEQLISDIDTLIHFAEKDKVDLQKVLTLFAPTAGLCEIASSNQSTDIYMRLASRFDDWYKHNSDIASRQK